MRVNVYNETGKKLEAVNLPNDLVSSENLPLLAQAMRVFENRQHPGVSRVKTRSEINASKRKIYKQKGTGGARHGAKSAPIFVGGGIAHGPTGNKRMLELPLKMRRKALQIALGVKIKEGSLVLVENITKLVKTKEAHILTMGVQKGENLKNPRFTVVLANENRKSTRTFRNLETTKTLVYQHLNAQNVFLGGTILLDAKALEKDPKSKLQISNSPKTKKVSKSSTKVKGKIKEEMNSKVKKPVKK